jgi:calpain-7
MIDSTWANLYKGTRYGDVLCTVATSNLDEATAKRLGLVPSHAYAVLDVREVNGIRLLQLKNPVSL